MAEKKFYKELRTLAKRANQRMVELERRGIKTAAYERVQGFLELFGVKRRSAKGRRFSETGKATYNEMETMTKFLKRFLGAQTSTVTGTKRYYKQVWESAERNYNISSYGITRDEYFEIWENLPNRERDRVFGSDTIIKMVSSALRKDKERNVKNEQSVTVAEIVKEIQAARNVKDAYRRIGITYKDMKKTNNLGTL